MKIALCKIRLSHVHTRGCASANFCRSRIRARGAVEQQFALQVYNVDYSKRYSKRYRLGLDSCAALRWQTPR